MKAASADWVLAAAVLVAGCRGGGPHEAPVASQATATDPGMRMYNDQVQPILRANCYRCHAGLNHRGGFSMATRAGLLHGGQEGVAVIPGDPANSLLVKLIRHEGPPGNPMPMPPKSKLSDADIATITRWIQAGAPMPEGPPE